MYLINETDNSSVVVIVVAAMVGGCSQSGDGRLESRVLVYFCFDALAL